MITVVAPGAATYKIEVQDLVAAHQLHNRIRMRSWQTMMVLGLLPPIGAAIAAGLRLGWPAVVCALVGSLVGGLAFPRALNRWYVPIAARRWFRKHRHLCEEVMATWDAEGLRLKSPISDVRTPWTLRRRWREDAHVILLYISDTLFHFIPKRALSHEQIASLHAHAAVAGVPGA